MHIRTYLFYIRRWFLWCCMCQNSDNLYMHARHEIFFFLLLLTVLLFLTVSVFHSRVSKSKSVQHDLKTNSSLSFTSLRCYWTGLMMCSPLSNDTYFFLLYANKWWKMLVFSWVVTMFVFPPGELCCTMGVNSQTLYLRVNSYIYYSCLRLQTFHGQLTRKDT